MICLGLDPGLSSDSCGFARLAIDGRFRSVLKAQALYLDTADTMEARMLDVSTRVSDELRTADLLVVEDQQPAAFVVVGRQNKHSARLQELVRLLQGVALAMSKPCLVVTPQKVRSVLGLRQGATKEQVWWQVSRMGAAAAVKSKHARDAIVLAVVGEKIWGVAARGKGAA